MHVVLGNQGGILNPSTSMVISVSSLVFFKNRLEVGQNLHSPSLLTNPDSSLAAGFSLLLSSEMCLSYLSPDISGHRDQVTIFRHEVSFRACLYFSI